MENVFFEPWVGNDYWNGGFKGQKILVVGNSHYCSDRDACSNCGVDGYCFDYDCSEFTSGVISKYLERSIWEPWMLTYEKFERALCGYRTDKNDARNIWDSIAFYNYLQTAVSSWTDQGNDSDYYNSQAAFWEVLEDLRPDCIIMWGSRVWNMTPGFNGCEDSYELSDGTQIPVLSIPHPSWRFFKWDEYNNKINDFINDL